MDLLHQKRLVCWFPVQIEAKDKLKKIGREKLTPPSLPFSTYRNTTINRKQTSKRASLKVRAEVRMIFSLARRKRTAFFDSHSFVLGRYISGRIRTSRIFFFERLLFACFNP